MHGCGGRRSARSGELRSRALVRLLRKNAVLDGECDLCCIAIKRCQRGFGSEWAGFVVLPARRCFIALMGAAALFMANACAAKGSRRFRGTGAKPRITQPAHETITDRYVTHVFEGREIQRRTLQMRKPSTSPPCRSGASRDRATATKTQARTRRDRPTTYSQPAPRARFRGRGSRRSYSRNPSTSAPCRSGASHDRATATTTQAPNAGDRSTSCSPPTSHAWFRGRGLRRSYSRAPSTRKSLGISATKAPPNRSRPMTHAAVIAIAYPPRIAAPAVPTIRDWTCVRCAPRCWPSC